MEIKDPWPSISQILQRWSTILWYIYSLLCFQLLFQTFSSLANFNSLDWTDNPTTYFSKKFEASTFCPTLAPHLNLTWFLYISVEDITLPKYKTIFLFQSFGFNFFLPPWKLIPLIIALASMFLSVSFLSFFFLHSAYKKGQFFLPFLSNHFPSHILISSSVHSHFSDLSLQPSLFILL